MKLRKKNHVHDFFFTSVPEKKIFCLFQQLIGKAEQYEPEQTNIDTMKQNNINEYQQCCFSGHWKIMHICKVNSGRKEFYKECPNKT